MCLALTVKNIRVAPHFSERRVLRMFREALTSGSEGSFAIEKVKGGVLDIRPNISGDGQVSQSGKNVHRTGQGCRVDRSTLSPGSLESVKVSKCDFAVG